MADITRKQKLINLHTSAMTDEKKVALVSALEFGEIAIKYAPSATTIYTKVKDSAETAGLAEFIDKTQVEALISAEGVEGVKTRVSALEALHADAASGKKSVATEVSEGIAGITAVTKSGNSHDVKVSATTEAGSIKSIVVEAPDFVNLYDAKGAAASAKTEVIGNSGDTWENKTLWGEHNRAADAESNLSTSISTLSGAVDTKIANLKAENNISDAVNGIQVKVDEANGIVAKPVITLTAGTIASGNTSVVLGGAVYDADVALKNELMGDAGEDYNTLGKLEDKIEAEATTRATNDTALSNRILENETKLTGFTQGQDVKAYVDGKVVGLLHFKGSVATIEALPELSSCTHGDVYNVVAAFDYEGKHYPAGTNVVAIKLDGQTPYWDALGGTVDLEPYAKIGSTGDASTVISLYGARAYAKELDDAMDTRVKVFEANGALSVATISGNVATISGNVNTLMAGSTVEGSVDYKVAQAKATIDAYTVNGIAISANPVLSGDNVTVGASYSKASAQAAIATGETIDVALGKLEKKVDDALATNDDHEGRLDTLEGGVSVSGSVDNKIDVAIKALDASVVNTAASAGSAASAQIKVKVDEGDGKLTAITVNAPAFDLSGAAATVKSELLGTAATYDDLTKVSAQLGVLGGEIDAEETRATNAENALSARLGDGVTSSSTATAQFATIKARAAKGISSAAFGTVETAGSTQSGAKLSVGADSDSSKALTIDLSELVIDCGEF